MMSSMRRMALPFAPGNDRPDGEQRPVNRPPARPLRVAPVNDVGYALNDWRRLRQGGNWAFADYARFLIANPGWPGESALRRAAEKAMLPGEYPATVIAFFRTQQPTSANGFSRLAEAFAAQGRSVDALAAARRAWSASNLSAADEIGLYQRFGSSFTTADHDTRVDRLLIDRDPDRRRPAARLDQRGAPPRFRRPHRDAAARTRHRSAVQLR